jgi:hypothetical protein
MACFTCAGGHRAAHAAAGTCRAAVLAHAAAAKAVDGVPRGAASCRIASQSDGTERECALVVDRAAQPGSPLCSSSGLGAVLFNLNGSVTIDFSTLAGNTLNGNNAQADSKGPEDGTVYSLAYGNKIQDGSASLATLTIRNSIIHGTHAGGGLQSDVSINLVNGNVANTNSSSLVYAGKNFIGQSYTVSGVTQTGTSPSTADPLLGALSIYSASSQYPLPVLPIGSNSPANDAASSCLEADNSTTLTIDERGAARYYGAQCDVGAYEFDGDYIFANAFLPKL